MRHVVFVSMFTAALLVASASSAASLNAVAEVPTPAPHLRANALTGGLSDRDTLSIASVGYEHTARSGQQFGLNCGMMFHGQARYIDPTAQGTRDAAIAQSDVLSRTAPMGGGVSDYHHTPVVQVNVGYRF